MKKIVMIAALALGALVLSSAAASAQAPQAAPEVPISIYFPEQASPIPVESSAISHRVAARSRSGSATQPLTSA